MEFKQKYSLPEVESVGEMLLEQLRPFTTRIEIMGSVRRGVPQVSDVELLAIPRYEGGLVDMFGDKTQTHNLFEETVGALVAEGLVLVKRPNKLGRYTYGEKNKFLIHPATGVPVDLFTATEENWGMSAVVRTGPAEFNIRLMARFRELGMRGHAYGGVSDRRPNDEVGDYWEHLDCPDEETVFRLAGWAYLPPKERKSA